MKLFICHASEDKIPFVNSLVSNLGHLNYFYDIYSLKIGDEISSVISEEIENSTGAIVVISSSFLKKSYPKNEFKLIINKKMSNENYKIFPIILDNVEQGAKKEFPILKSLWGPKGFSDESSAREIATEILHKLQVKTDANAKDLKSIEINSNILIENLRKVKDWDEVLSKRYGIGYRYMTLREIGEEFNVTRERIRQREEKAEERLRAYCSENKYLKDFMDKILSRAVYSERVSVTTLKDIVSTVKYQSIEDSIIKQIVKLIVNVNGYVELRNSYGLDTIFIKCNEEIEMSRVALEVDKIINYLRFDKSTPVDLNALKADLALELPLDILKIVLTTLEFIQSDNELYYVKFSDLGKLSSMAERVLFELKAPAKAGTILEEIRLKSLHDQELLNKLNKRLLIQQMSSEKERFFTNKKGFWCISENKNEVKDYSYLLLNILKKYENPIDRKSLLQEVQALDIDEKGKRSIKVYLTAMKEIRCLVKTDKDSNEQYYILGEYNFDEKKFSIKKKRELKKPRTAELLQSAITKINEFFISKSISESRLKDLAKYLQKEMKLRRREYAYGYIKKSGLVEYDQNVSRDMTVKFKKTSF